MTTPQGSVYRTSSAHALTGHLHTVRTHHLCRDETAVLDYGGKSMEGHGLHE